MRNILKLGPIDNILVYSEENVGSRFGILLNIN